MEVSMSARFQELDWKPTPMGEISLRRRWDPLFDKEVLEIKLGDDYLMSSLFTVAEIEMARLALEPIPGIPLDIVVGGLGLGYTASAVLKNPTVRSLLVIESLNEVIDWHTCGLIPAGPGLMCDSRCVLVQGDFFATLRNGASFDGQDDGVPDCAHAIIVDIDHSPRHLLHPSHADFYTPEGLRQLVGRLHPGGVFALWSNDPPDQEFIDSLEEVFAAAAAKIVRFDNPIQAREATNTVYVACAPSGADPSI